MRRREWNERPIPYRLGPPTPLAVRLLGGPIHALVRILHRATAEGWEHLPASGAYLLVANHPPCLGSGEFFSFMALWIRRFGSSRPLAGFTHVAAHAVWPMPWIFRQIGAIPSTYAAAEDALARGIPVAIFPGGDHEAFQPFWVHGADFAGREGFLRIAREAGVPVVPMGIRGQSAPVLHRSRALAWLAIWPRAIGVKRFGLTVLGVLGAAAMLSLPLPWYLRVALAWAWALSPLALLSWFPGHTHVRVGRPMPAGSTSEEVERAVTGLLQTIGGSVSRS